MNDETTWRAFFDAAIAFRDLKPWEWMYDSDLFAVKDPETGQINYCCIMGNAGEVFALGLYLGEEGFKSYSLLLNSPDELTDADRAALALQQRLLKVEFINREEMDKPDLDLLKDLGLKFRGKNQWVQLRELQPGYLPMPVAAEQARLMTVALQQAVEAALLFRPGGAWPAEEDEQMLLREKVNDQWVNRFFTKDLLIDIPFPVIDPDKKRLRECKKKYLQKEAAWLYLFEYLHSPIGDGENGRPYWPKIGIWINYGDGMISGFQLMKPGEEQELIASDFFAQIERAGFRPSQIGVHSVMALRALSALCDGLEIELIFVPDEPIFEEVMNSFARFR